MSAPERFLLWRLLPSKMQPLTRRHTEETAVSASVCDLAKARAHRRAAFTHLRSRTLSDTAFACEGLEMPGRYLTPLVQFVGHGAIETNSVLSTRLANSVASERALAAVRVCKRDTCGTVRAEGSRGCSRWNDVAFGPPALTTGRSSGRILAMGMAE